MILTTGPGARALVVPDLAAMAQLPVNSTVAAQNDGIVFVDSLAARGSVQKAINAFNGAVATPYSPTSFL